MRQSSSRVALLALALTACASGLDGARQAVTNAERVEVATASALADFSLRYQHDQIDPLIHDAETAEEAGDRTAARDLREQARVIVSGFRAKRDKAATSVLMADFYVSQARALIDLIDRGLRSQADLAPLLASVVEAIATAQAEFVQLKGSTP